MRPDPEPPPTGDDWSVDLDAPGGARPADPPSPRVRLIAAVLAIAAVATVAVLWRPGPAPDIPAVLGTHLAIPIALTRPDGAVTTADSSYVGLQFAAGGVVLVTVPTGVVDPSGVRRPLPDDPSAWLARHPAIFISRVRAVRLGDVRATQLDYRRSRMDAPPSRFARLPLFCGWRPENDAASSIASACTQITADARVRATFVPVGGRTVLVEAVWSAVQGATGRMPRDLQRSYAALLAGVQLRSGPIRQSVAKGGTSHSVCFR